MYYIVQENTFREENYDNLIHNLNRLQLDYEIIKVLPFIDEIEFKTNRKDVFVFGSLKLARIAKLYNWIPGSYMNENHDYVKYSKYYKNNLLNHDSEIYNFIDDFKWGTERKFIRPCLDTKVFTGKVFNEVEWKEFVNYSLTNGHTTSLNSKTKIQICSTKNIDKEIRFWIINKKIITFSQYRLGHRIVYNNLVDNQSISFVESMIEKFQLADAFVMDVCLIDNEWKIVECGCINCAGFYHSDLQKILIALEEM